MKSILCVLAVAALIAAAPKSVALQSAIATAENRCNGRMLNDMQDQVRDFERHPPRGQQATVDRFNALDGILASLAEERGVLNSVCPSEDAKLPLYAELANAASLGLALQSDLIPALNPCPAGATAMQQALLGQAWLDLALVVNNDAGGTMPPQVAQAEPQIQSRAAKAGLTLPTIPETSSFWLSQVKKKGDDATAAGCPSASPAPAASPKVFANRS